MDKKEIEAISNDVTNGLNKARTSIDSSLAEYTDRIRDFRGNLCHMGVHRKAVELISQHSRGKFKKSEYTRENHQIFVNYIVKTMLHKFNTVVDEAILDALERKNMMNVDMSLIGGDVNHLFNEINRLNWGPYRAIIANEKVFFNIYNQNSDKFEMDTFAPLHPEFNTYLPRMTMRGMGFGVMFVADAEDVAYAWDATALGLVMGDHFDVKVKDSDENLIVNMSMPVGAEILDGTKVLEIDWS